MDGPLAFAAQNPGPESMGAETVRIGKIAERSINGPQPIGAGRHDHAGNGVMPHVAPVNVAVALCIRVGQHMVIRVRTADGGDPRLGRGGIVGNPEVQRLVARTGPGDLVDVHHAERRFDDHLNTDPLLGAGRRFDLADQGIDGIDVGRRADLGNHDQVELIGGLFQDVDDVAVHVMGIEAVDPYGNGFRTVIEGIERLDNVLAGLFLVIGRHRVFQVEENHIGIAAGGFFQKTGI